MRLVAEIVKQHDAKPKPMTEDPQQIADATKQEETDDEFLTGKLFPLKRNGWFDGSEQTC